MKRISLEKLTGSRAGETYEQQYFYIRSLLDKGAIKPLKASGTNGKKPALYREYWVIEEKKDYSLLEEELKYSLVPLISIDYYMKHQEVYEQDRPWVLKLNDYLKKDKHLLEKQESMNERSFEIWQREKFLSREQGKTILKRCGLEPDFLNIYDTTEPLAYYSHTRKTPQNLLILENKDTFYSMRRYLMEGNECILGMPVGTLIYGAGKGILRSFRDFELCAEPYMKEKKNHIYYFGDLDYEGIGIYEKLWEIAGKQWEILPFTAAYAAMLHKVQITCDLPKTKEQQNRNIKEIFFSYFTEEQKNRMKKILEDDCYIPQEILNIADL